MHQHEGRRIVDHVKRLHFFAVGLEPRQRLPIESVHRFVDLRVDARDQRRCRKRLRFADEEIGCELLRRVGDDLDAFERTSPSRLRVVPPRAAVICSTTRQWSCAGTWISSASAAFVVLRPRFVAPASFCARIRSRAFSG